MEAEARVTEALTLRLEGVSKRFRGAAPGAPQVQALRNIGFTLAPGRLLGLVGPDGAGKTTLLRILAGLALADEGVVEVMGSPVARIDRASLGYMPQGGALYFELSVAQNLELYARLRGIEPGENPERLEQLYEMTGLSAFRGREVGRLSGGMRQKLALACAVVAAPPLMLLDEPSVGVDPVSRREVWKLARDLAGPESCIVWATSILDDAERCDDLLVLHEGEVRFSGEARGLALLAKGRTFYRPVPAEERRAAVYQALNDPKAVSGGIEVQGIRLLLRDEMAPPGDGWKAVRPRADDGFSTLLDDGKPLGESKLAASFPDRNAEIGEVSAIVAEGLTKCYGAFAAARDVSFSVRSGEIFGLLGPNGAGKSTTFRMLCGLLGPTSGKGTVAGRDLLRSRSAARQEMGYMPQKFSLYGDLTVFANLSFVAGAYGMDRAATGTAIENAVAALSLGPYLETPSGILPLGIKQRLALAAAVLHKPRVLFLDEPTSGVDPLVRREFWHHINAIAAKGVAVLVTTHFMDEAENCDRLLLINQAEAIAQGTPDELKRMAGCGLHETLEDAFIALIENMRVPVRLPATEGAA